MDKEKCKICGWELDITDLFCPVCGFEHHNLPCSISDEVKKYEDDRVKEYQSRWEEHNALEKLKEEMLRLSDELQQVNDELEKTRRDLDLAKRQPKEEPVVGYLVIRETSEEKVVGVLRVLEGKNYYGTNPLNHENAHIEQISAKCKGLRRDHFYIEVLDEKTTPKASLLDGDWIIASYNHDRSIVLQSESSFQIENLSFTYFGI